MGHNKNKALTSLHEAAGKTELMPLLRKRAEQYWLTFKCLQVPVVIRISFSEVGA
jgi:hypothetical protein